MTFQRVLNKNDIYIKSRKIFFSKEEAIYPMVSLSASDTNSEKRGEFSMTLYYRDNCRISGKNTGKLKDIKNGANIVHPIPVFD